MPRQNAIDVKFTPEQNAQWESALATLESLAALFPTITPAEKRAWVRAPEGSEGWMADLLTRASQNLSRLPRDFEIESVQRDLDLAAWLGPHELRVSRLLQRIETARFLARSDAFAELLSARRVLRDAGVSGVDDDLNEGLHRFFQRQSKSAAAKPADPATPETPTG